MAGPRIAMRCVIERFAPRFRPHEFASPSTTRSPIRRWTVTIPKNLVADDELIEFMCENEKDFVHMVGK